MIVSNITNNFTAISVAAAILLVVMAIVGISLVCSVRRMEDEEELRQREVALLRRKNNELKRKCEAKQTLINWYVDQAREGGYNVDR